MHRTPTRNMKDEHEKEKCPDCGKPLRAKRSWGGLKACYCKFGGKKPTAKQVQELAEAEQLPASRRPDLIHVCGRCLSEVEIPRVGTPTCKECGNTGRGSWRTVQRCRKCKGACQQNDPVRPCRKCGELIGHGAWQHQCNVCLGDCCTACSHDGDAGAIICDDCHKHYAP